MQTLGEIKALIDATTPRLQPAMDFAARASAVGADPTTIRTPRDLLEFLHGEVGRSFSSGHSGAWRLCRQWLDLLVFHHVANHGPWSPYYGVFVALRDGFRVPSLDRSWVGSWPRAVQAARDIVALNPDLMSRPQLTAHGETVWWASAARRLSHLGRSRVVREVPVELSRERHHSIAQHIHRLAEHLGGDAIAAHLFGELAPSYDRSMSRYHHVNRFTSSLTAIGPRLPANFLLQLAARYPTAKKPFRRSREAWLHLRQACIDYAALHRVQPDSCMWAIGEGDPIEHAHLLWKLTLHDALFTLEQVRSSDLPFIAGGLFAGLRLQGGLPAGCEEEVTDLVGFLVSLHGCESVTTGPLFFSREQLRSLAAEMDPKRVDELVRKYLAHPAPGANQRYSVPTQVPDKRVERSAREGADFWQRPLLTAGKDRFLLLDAAACSSSTFEAVLGAFRAYAVSDTSLGKAAEEVILQSIRRCGIEPHWGKYETRDGSGEFDAVIEAADTVILIEAKRKPLTRAARAGRELSALVDLSRSVLKATIQTGTQELRLRMYEGLTLTRDDGTSSRIELRGRRVQRIAISLQDYGSFQDKRAAEVLLSNHRLANFGLLPAAPDDSETHREIAEVNALTLELRTLDQRLFEQAGSPENWRPYRNCWFLSVPQWLCLLDDVRSQEDLAHMLSRLETMLFASRDFYFELHRARQMRDSAEGEGGGVVLRPA